jgi:hypothetical protein
MTDIDHSQSRYVGGALAMQIAELTEDIALIVPMLILAEGVVGLIVWFAFGSKGGRGARIAAWLGLVTLTLWCGSAAAFVLVHILLFTLGNGAAVVGAALVTVFMVAMPFGWAVLVRHHGRGSMETGPIVTAQSTGTQPR